MSIQIESEVKSSKKNHPRIVSFIFLTGKSSRYARQLSENRGVKCRRIYHLWHTQISLN